MMCSYVRIAAYTVWWCMECGSSTAHVRRASTEQVMGDKEKVHAAANAAVTGLQHSTVLTLLLPTLRMLQTA